MLPRDEIIQAIRNADAAGDSASVRRLGEYLRTMQEQPAQPHAQAAPPAAASWIAKAGRDVARSPGLAARYAMEGAPQMADMLLSPVRAGLNAVSGAFGGPQAAPLATLGARAADSVGLPQPMNASERVVGDAARMVAGAAGGAGPAALAEKAMRATSPIAAKMAGALAQAPVTQAAVGAGAGAGAGAAREGGADPLSQAGAGLLVGLAAPAAMGAVSRAASAAKVAGAKALDPAKLDQTLKIELQRAGVNWDDLGAQVRMQLRKDAEGLIYRDQPIDQKALGNLAAYRQAGATPLIGDITQDPILLTRQRNLSKQLANQQGATNAARSLPQIENENAQRIIANLDGAASSPLDEFATGQALIGRVQAKDAALKAKEKRMYASAEEAAGRTIPLDRRAFVDQAFANLAASNRASFLPESVGRMLDQIAAGTVSIGGKSHAVPFDVNTIDQLKTVLSSASRSTADGNTRAAVSAVRQALQDAAPSANAVKPQFGGNQAVNAATATAMREGDAIPAEAMRRFDEARSFARGRRQWQESSAAVKAALDDAAPDDFVKKHIIGADVRDLEALKREIGRTDKSSLRELAVREGEPAASAAPSNQVLHDAVRKQLIGYIQNRAKINEDVAKFSSAGMNDALNSIGQRKLEMFFSPREIADLRATAKTARLMQSQPAGSAVNNSNSAAMLMGRLSDLLARGTGIPGVGPWAAGPLQGVVMSAQARSLRDLSRGLSSQPAQAAPAGAYALPLSALLAAPPVNSREDQHGR
jgi:hypothetical protein